MRRVLVGAVLVGCLALTRCDEIVRQGQPKQQSQVNQQAVSSPRTPEQHIDVDKIDLADLLMRLSTTRAMTGDVRPYYIVSGRINNHSYKTLESVTIRVFVETTGSPDAGSPDFNKNWQILDEADLHIEGPIHSPGTKGFSQQVQLLPPSGKSWTWEADVVDAKAE